MEKKVRTPIAPILLILTSFLMLSRLLVFFERLTYGEPVAQLISAYLFTFLEFIIYLALCFTLFAKKHNNVLVIVLGSAAVLHLIILLNVISVGNLLSFAAFALLLVFAISGSEQTLIKADLSKVKSLSAKLFFLPAILLFIASILGWMPLRDDGFYLFGYYFSGIAQTPTIITDLLLVLAFVSIAHWLKSPYSTAVNTNGTDDAYEYGEAYCGLGKHIVLCLFTFGIWYLIWTYRTTKYLNKAPNVVQYIPVRKLLLCMFIPFYQLYWFYKHGQRIDAITRQKKLNNSDMATLCLILGIFIPIVACILMQDRINTLCTAKAAAEEPNANLSETEQLKKYKELLDSGVISQEEFDAKKKQLFGL